MNLCAIKGSITWLLMHHFNFFYGNPARLQPDKNAARLKTVKTNDRNVLENETPFNVKARFCFNTQLQCMLFITEFSFRYMLTSGDCFTGFMSATSKLLLRTSLVKILL